MVVAMCSSFLTVRDDHVYFVHQSAKDYLSSSATTIHPDAASRHRGFFHRNTKAHVFFPTARHIRFGRSRVSNQRGSSANTRPFGCSAVRMCALC